MDNYFKKPNRARCKTKYKHSSGAGYERVPGRRTPGSAGRFEQRIGSERKFKGIRKFVINAVLLILFIRQ